MHRRILQPSLTAIRLMLFGALSWFIGMNAANAQDVPQWIWSTANPGANEEVYFRKSFTVTGTPSKAMLSISADNHAIVWINGTEALKNDEWSNPSTVAVAKLLKPGVNLIAVYGRNDGGAAGLLVRLRMQDSPHGKATDVISDASWRQGAKVDGWEKPAFDDNAWKPVFDVCALGGGPWGDLALDSVVGGGVALSVPDGFKADLVYSVPGATQGSWVSMTCDDKGRLITSDQNGGIFRLTLPAGGEGEPTVEAINLPIGQAHGLLYAFDSLYVMVNGNKYPDHHSGLYRLQCSHGGDVYDTITKLRDFDGEGEHGPHGLALGPDHKIYFAVGDMTKPMKQVDVSLPSTFFGEDFALPRHWDPSGFSQGLLAPAGYIGRTDAEGKKWELVSMGYRNIYDLAFDANGELFSWDSDMEWDMGTPWYRPIRVSHVVSGGDMGWRAGTGKYPEYYADSQPPMLNIGPGSPTGMSFGYGAKFPASYQRALFILDWTFGTVYAVHLTPAGASFTATREEFVFGRPLPVTAVAIGKDGAMYLSVGGRGTTSAVYRITYVGDESTAAVAPLPPTPAALERHELEAFQAKQDPAAVAAVWPYLGDGDRFLRMAARVALEHQPVAEWQDRALAETKPQAAITALIALARCADKSVKDKAFASFVKIDVGNLGTVMQLEAIRACELLIIRLGMPDAAVVKRLVATFDPLFPATDNRLNSELSEVLSQLDAPGLIDKVLGQMASEEPKIVLSHDLDQLIARNGGYGGPIAQMLSSKPQQMHIHYAQVLSTITHGWDLAQRGAYMSWFDIALNQSSGGNSFGGFIRGIRNEALEHIPSGERQAVLDAAAAARPKVPPTKRVPLPEPKGPGKEWTIPEVAAMAKTGLHQRSFEDGKNMFAACQCTLCHRYAGAGGSAGPDLSSVATRYQAIDIIKKVIAPAKILAEQYRGTTFTTRDGQVISGRVISEDAQSYSVAAIPTDPSILTVIQKSNVKKKAPSEISVMPPGMLNRLNKDEVLDLLAFLVSSGNTQDPMFK